MSVSDFPNLFCTSTKYSKNGPEFFRSFGHSRSKSRAVGGSTDADGHFWLRTAYLALTQPVPARIRRQLGTRASVLRDFADPPHIVRWMDDDRLLITGADTDSPSDQRRDKLIVQRTGQLMYELSTVYPDISGILPAYGWHAEYAKTAEGLPYIGPHRNFPHHLFVFGDSSHSLTGAYLASRILLRHHSEEVAAADQVFAFTR